MAIKLSVTDQSPIHDGGRPSRGPHDSLRLAQACERFGYHRYWLAEHHNTPGYAGPCPEILIGHIAAHTRRIRVGSGGIMLLLIALLAFGLGVYPQPLLELVQQSGLLVG